MVPSTEPRATTMVSASSAAIGVHQAAGVAAEDLLELGGHLRDALQRLHLLGVGEVAHLHEGLGADHRADATRLVRVEHLARLEGRQEGVDLRPARARRRARPRG
jgi:hypothetical protein